MEIPMAKRLLAERVADLGSLRMAKAAGTGLRFTPQELAHIYVKLDFKHQYENAATTDDAKKFLRSVNRAAMAAHQIAEWYGGFLLEVQGSTLHVALPHRPGITESAEKDSAIGYVADLHWTY